MDEINNVDDLIRFIETITNTKLKTYQKLWLKFSSWADYKIERAFKMR